APRSGSPRRWASMCTACLLIAFVLPSVVAAAGARTEDAPPVASGAAAAPTPPARPSAPPAAAVDAEAGAPLTRAEAQYEGLLDVAFQALYDGDLILAEAAFRQAGSLPGAGDPARAAVAASFAERVRHLRATSRPVPARPGRSVPDR